MADGPTSPEDWPRRIGPATQESRAFYCEVARFRGDKDPGANQFTAVMDKRINNEHTIF
jgi:hypothetical protein